MKSPEQAISEQAKHWEWSQAEANAIKNITSEALASQHKRVEQVRIDTIKQCAEIATKTVIDDSKPEQEMQNLRSKVIEQSILSLLDAENNSEGLVLMQDGVTFSHFHTKTNEC